MPAVYPTYKRFCDLPRAYKRPCLYVWRERIVLHSFDNLGEERVTEINGRNAISLFQSKDEPEGSEGQANWVLPFWF